MHPVTLEEVADALRTVDECRRVVVCPVGDRLKIEALVLRYGMDHLWRVEESRHCPAGTFLLINDPGVLT